MEGKRIFFRCPHCRQHLKATEQYAEREAKCSNCEKIVEVPPESEPQADPKKAEPILEEADIFTRSRSSSNIPAQPGEMATEASMPKKRCPHCGQSILENAIRCKYCGHFVSVPVDRHGE